MSALFCQVINILLKNKPHGGTSGRLTRLISNRTISRYYLYYLSFFKGLSMMLTWWNIHLCTQPDITTRLSGLVPLAFLKPSRHSAV